MVIPSYFNHLSTILRFIVDRFEREINLPCDTWKKESLTDVRKRKRLQISEFPHFCSTDLSRFSGGFAIRTS